MWQGFKLTGADKALKKTIKMLKDLPSHVHFHQVTYIHPKYERFILSISALSKTHIRDESNKVACITCGYVLPPPMATRLLL